MENLKDKAIKFKGSDYVQVKDRILYLAEQYEGKYSVETNYQYYPNEKMRIVKATLTINGCVYTGLAQEIEGTTFINKTSALENAETSAVGRACAMAGIGVIDSIASIDEINKANNRKDKPEFTDELFEKFKTKKNNYKSFQEAITKLEENYKVPKGLSAKIMDLYGTSQTPDLPF